MTIDVILEVVLSLIAVFMAIVFHEVAHGYIASRLGDPTAKSGGRLSLNPLAHVDPIGTILVPLTMAVVQILAPAARPVFFGWAKPVPVNPNYFKNPMRGMLYVALAGPGSNIAFALVAAGLGRLIFLGVPGLANTIVARQGLGGNALHAVFYVLGMFVIYCVILAIFNLIPLPPLDGSRVLTYFLPPGGRRVMLSLERYGFIILIFIVFLGGLDFLFSGIAPLWTWLLGGDWLFAMFA
jgi:Zn-dependent protease